MSNRKGKTTEGSSPHSSTSAPGSGAGARAEEIQQLVHTLSHDLRNPIGSILGYVDLLRDTAGGALNAEHLAFLKRIEENCREMLEDLARFTARLDQLVR